MTREKTRKCRYCDRRSSAVAQDMNCPWCRYKTGKYYYVINWTMSFVAGASILVMAWKFWPWSG